MDNFFVPFLASMQNEDKHFDILTGDMPFFFYLSYMAYNLEKHTLEQLMEMQKKSISKDGEYNMTDKLKHIFLEPNSLYMAKLISLMIERHSLSVCLIGNN